MMRIKLEDQESSQINMNYEVHKQEIITVEDDIWKKDKRLRMNPEHDVEDQEYTEEDDQPIFLEILIKEIEKRPVLYKACKCKQEIDAKWMEIFHVFNGAVPLHDLKKRWRWQRERYMKVRAQMKKYTKGQSRKKMSYKYYDFMHFLDGGIEEKEQSQGKSSILQIPPLATSKQQIPLHKSETIPSNDSSVVPIEISSQDDSSTSVEINSPLSKFNYFQKTECHCSDKALSGIKTELITEIKNIFNVTNTVKDEIDGFCLRVAGSLHRLPLKKRTEVEIRILQLLAQAEFSN